MITRPCSQPRTTQASIAVPGTTPLSTVLPSAVLPSAVLPSAVLSSAVPSGAVPSGAAAADRS